MPSFKKDAKKKKAGKEKKKKTNEDDGAKNQEEEEEVQKEEVKKISLSIPDVQDRVTYCTLLLVMMSNRRY